MKTKTEEMRSEEAERETKEREQMKKLMAEYKRKVNKEMEKHVKEMEDEKLKEVLREIEEAQAKHPGEKRKAAKSITKINEKHWDELYQGDIVLSVEQAQYLLDTVTKNGQQKANSQAENGAERREKRGTDQNGKKETFPILKWPLLTIPFSFHSIIPDKLRQEIHFAIQLWNRNTCLSMVEHGPSSPGIQFINVSGKGCSSWVGRRSEPTHQQQIYLEYPDCYLSGIIAHEIGHALGLTHEHQRYDRDTYVWYIADNVKLEKIGNFDKLATERSEDHKTPYDLGSVMHYGAKGASTNDKHTLIPKAGAHYINTIGQRFGPSFGDFLLMNKYYCGLQLLPDGSSINTEVCFKNVMCENDGFQKPKSCTECICPTGYAGNLCEKVDTDGYAPAGVTNNCKGAIFIATSEWQDLHGEIGSDSLDSSTDHAYCHWQILAEIGQLISIQVLAIGDTCEDACESGNTEIRTEANKGISGLRLCCLSDLGSTGQLEISAPYGYAMISLYSFYKVQRFHLRFMQHED
ncbi:hypothetical protein niasHT_032120 [Heterodera trifolii]|uniref:Zinc metalloproteinase n=1 Tax=Heterodera trifolii TaxID=157864 RepID=A0ABD2HNM2_9BILA